MSTQDLELALDGERRAAEDARQAAALLERKRIALQTELDDVRAMLDAVSSLSSLLSLSVSCPSLLNRNQRRVLHFYFYEQLRAVFAAV